MGRSALRFAPFWLARCRRSSLPQGLYVTNSICAVLFFIRGTFDCLAPRAPHLSPGPKEEPAGPAAGEPCQTTFFQTVIVLWLNWYACVFTGLVEAYQFNHRTITVCKKSSGRVLQRRVRRALLWVRDSNTVRRVRETPNNQTDPELPNGRSVGRRSC